MFFMLADPPFWPPMPTFTPHQDAALTAASNWLKAARGRASIFRLFGYAGTGKTTLAKHLAEGVDGKVLFAAFTGKAACVMRSKGCQGPQPDLQGARTRRGDAELRAVGRGARLQGEAHRHRRMLDGRCRACARPDVVRRTAIGARRPGATAADPRWRLFHRRRAR